MQSAGTRLEGNIRFCWIVRQCFNATPHAGAAVDALFAIKHRDALFTGKNGLAGAYFDAHFILARLAKLWLQKDDVVLKAGVCLHFSAGEQRILVGY